MPEWNRRQIVLRGAAVLSVVSAGRFSGLAQPAVAQDQIRLTVSAAADLTMAFEEIGRFFEEEQQVGVDFNFGSTGQLYQQIANGAPVDLFAAADIAYIDQLDQQGLIVPGSRSLYAIGRIVIWTRADSPLEIEAVDQLSSPQIATVAIANPDHAPYGVAAREALQSAGIWDAIQDKLVLGENVRDTLRYAETGNVDVAIVALSLAIQGDGRWTLIADDLHEPIEQGLGVIAGTRYEGEASAFANFINGERGREIMRAYGFGLPGEELITATPGSATPTSARVE